jgi:hypothetical protein
MAREQSRSQVLRNLADAFLATVSDDDLTSSRAELATSLVRQWITNNSRAVLYLGEKAHFLRVEFDGSRAELYDNVKPNASVWFRQDMRDWEIDEDVYREGIRQLNIGQSAIIENRRGEYLRLWVNPEGRGIEALSKSLMMPPGAVPMRDFSKLARDRLEEILGSDVDAQTREELVASIVGQWARHGGRAIIVVSNAEFQFTVRPSTDGTELLVTESPTDIPEMLRSIGVGVDELQHLFRAINLGHIVEFTDRQGQRSRIKADPVNGIVAIERDLPPTRHQHNLRFDDLTPP